MVYKLERPAADFDAPRGLLISEHFQMAYATNDMAQAKALFAQTLGITSFCTLEGPTASGGYIHTELAWVGSIMYELICASGPGSELYMSGLPQDAGFAMRHHHLGFLIHNQGQWDATLAHAQHSGAELVYRNVNALVEVCFIKPPALGHYLEYLFATPLGLEFFGNVPRN